MFAEIRKRLSRVSPRVAVTVGLLIAFVAGSGVALLLMQGGETVDADDAVEAIAARIDRVDGSVGIARVLDENTEPEWDDAAINTPVSVGDRIHTRDNSRASIALTGRNFVRLDSGASLDVLELGDQRTQLALRSGSAIFDVGALEPNAFYEVATPCGAVDFTQPGLYQVGIDGDTALISVLSGLAQVVGASGSGYINKGEVYTLVNAAASEVAASTLAPNLAGGIVDDYYRYRHPSRYDGRYRSYDAYVSDPFYYDPYRSSASYNYVSADIPGLHDLDDYGDWTNIDGYGHCWAPRVGADWAPYRTGSWDLYNAWGPTWVSHEPWGWAPYHYGRWTYAQQRWFWVPVEVRTRRSYCPATVAFIPVSHDQIGWVPLAPGERYVPRYYDASFRPRYLASRQIVREVSVQRTFVNLNSPSGVTVVPVRSLKRRIEPNLIARVDQQVIGRSKPTQDAFLVGGVRDFAIKSKGEGRRLKLDRTEQQAFERPVITSRRPANLPAGANLTKALRVEPVSGEVKRKTLKIDRTGQVITARRPDGLPQAMAQNQGRKDPQHGAIPENTPSQPGQQPAQQEQLRRQMKKQLKTQRQQQSGASQAEAARQAQQQQQQKMRQQQNEQKRSNPKPPAAVAPRQRWIDPLRRQQQIQEQSRIRSQQEAAKAQQQQRQQMQNRQPKGVTPPPKRKPPQASIQPQPRINQGFQMREQARTQRAQRQEATRQQGQARMQQQRAMIEQQRMAARQSQPQFKSRPQQQQGQMVMRQQAARQPAFQRQPARTEQPQRSLGPPPGKANTAQTQQRAEKVRRKPS